MNGYLGGFEEEGFCFGADAILAAMRERVERTEEREGRGAISNQLVLPLIGLSKRSMT